MLILIIFHYVTMTFFLERYYLVIQIIFYQRYVLVYLKCVILFMENLRHFFGKFK